MARKFDAPEFLTRMPTKTEALLGPVSQTISTLPSSWDKYKLRRMQEQKQLAEFGTGETAPGTTETPEEEMRRVGTDRYRTLHPVSSEVQYTIPTYDNSGNVTGYTPVPKGQKPFGGGKPPSPGKGNVAPEMQKQAYNLYETARDGLLSGLEGSETGPFVGRLPAMTSAQQTAEGAVAAMAPVLKQLFRVSGEGVFTDRDQALLLDMIPTRKTRPEARKSQIENIDRIVKAKLGIDKSQESQTGNVHDEALQWAEANPDDPRAMQILKLHGR